MLASFEESDSIIETPVAEAAAQLLTGDRAESLVGQQLGHYETIALLGEGGMGTVYLAKDTRLRPQGRFEAPAVLLYKRCGPLAALRAGSARRLIAQPSEHSHDL